MCSEKRERSRRWIDRCGLFWHIWLAACVWHAWHGIRERWWNQKRATGSSRGRVEEKDEGGRPGAQETTRLGTTGRCMHADAAAGCMQPGLAGRGRGGKTQIIPAHFGHAKRGTFFIFIFFKN